jgi:predicted ATPase
MRLTGFQVQMFKCVIDSGWIAVTPLTVLVGKNESGKTALLKALHKFNPFRPEPYAAREWPRGHRDTRSAEQVVCVAEFELSPGEEAELLSLTNTPLPPGKLKVTRDFAGKFEVVFPSDVLPQKLHPNEVDRICGSLPEPPQAIGATFEAQARSCKEEAVRLAHEGRFSELAALPGTHRVRLQSAIGPADQQPQHKNENAFVQEYATAMEALSRTLLTSPTIQQRAHEYVVSHLPTFVYLDEYGIFKGYGSLSQVKQRKDQGKLTEEDKTFLTILEQAGLSLEREVEKAAGASREDRQYDLDDAAATLTRKISTHWKALRYEVDFRGDADEFFTFVKSEKDRSLIRLEERSRGFQWFFSFDLMLMHETKGTLKDCVILLDEPALHLHPQAQRDLLERLQEYTGGNTLIYTTHLPFMIDLKHPERIRVISETEQGSVVSEDLTKSQPEAKLVLQAALGIGGRLSCLVAERNLVVEGTDDGCFIGALSNLLVRSGRPGLPADVMISAAGGASEVTYLATFMTGQGLDVIALYDSDAAADTAKDTFIKSWLARYKGSNAAAVSLGPAIGVPERDVSIEDLFAEDVYLKYVYDFYRLQLAGAGVTTITLAPGDQLVKRIEAFFSGIGVNFNKSSIANRLCADLNKMRSIDELRGTKDKAGALITAINSALEW